MFKKLSVFLKENKITNLYTIRLEDKDFAGLYSLTRPIVIPEHEITTFFEKPTMQSLSPEGQLSLKLTTKNKTNAFGESFNVK